jgi:hypothetical protein
MLRPDGLVKVLDFGIAKLIERPSLLLPASNDDRDTAPLKEDDADSDPYTTTPDVKVESTAPGVILGTVTYMSPEQLRGQKIDARSDIFSLGIVLYEMIAGVPPFSGKTQADKIAAILEHEPDPLTDYRPDVPAELGPIISKALCKDRDYRYQNVKDLLADLKGLKEELEFKEKLERSGRNGMRNQGAVSKTARHIWRRLLARSTAIALIVATLLVTGLNWRSCRVVALNTAGDPVFVATLRQGEEASAREGFYIESIFSITVTGDLEAGRKIGELWSQACPRDHIPLNHLYGLSVRSGEYRKGLSATRRSLSLDPEKWTHLPLLKQSRAEFAQLDLRLPYME